MFVTFLVVLTFLVFPEFPGKRHAQEAAASAPATRTHGLISCLMNRAATTATWACSAQNT